MNEDGDLSIGRKRGDDDPFMGSFVAGTGSPGVMGIILPLFVFFGVVGWLTYFLLSGAAPAANAKTPSGVVIEESVAHQQVMMPHRNSSFTPAPVSVAEIFYRHDQEIAFIAKYILECQKLGKCPVIAGVTFKEN